MTTGDRFLTDALKKMDAKTATIALAAINRFRKTPIVIAPPPP